MECESKWFRQCRILVVEREDTKMNDEEKENVMWS